LRGSSAYLSLNMAKRQWNDPSFPRACSPPQFPQSKKPLSPNPEEISAVPSWVPFSNTYVLAAP
jgi:hypothetical protein